MPPLPGRPASLLPPAPPLVMGLSIAASSNGPSTPMPPLPWTPPLPGVPPKPTPPVDVIGRSVAASGIGLVVTELPPVPGIVAPPAPVGPSIFTGPVSTVLLFSPQELASAKIAPNKRVHGDAKVVRLNVVLKVFPQSLSAMRSLLGCVVGCK